MKKAHIIIIAFIGIMFLLRSQKNSGNYMFLEKGIDSLFAQSDLVGFSAGIIEGEEMVWSMARGMADLKKETQVDINTLFMLGSLSKTATGAALMHLYDQGKLDLDEDINVYLPFIIRNPGFSEKSITIRMLLTHTSSLLDNNKYLSSLYGCGDQTQLSFSDYIRNCYSTDGSEFHLSNFAEYAPGEGWEYCNSNYVLIAFLVERISGESFTDYCRKNLFKPLQMKRTAWLYSEIDLDSKATNYISESEASQYPDHPRIDHVSINGKNGVCNYSWPGYPDGGLHTSVPQFANFMIMLMNGGKFKGKQILRPETVENILTPQNAKGMISSPRYKRIDMGLTWWLRETETEYFFSHAGGGSGITTFAFFDPNKKYGAVFFITGDWHDKAYDREMFDLFRKHFKNVQNID